MIVRGRLLRDADRPPAPGWLAIEDGRIAEIGAGDAPPAADVGGPERLVTPGFVDAHVHLPQIDAVGCERADLLAWLDDVIFPAEARWADRAAAGAGVEAAYRRMLRSGTLAYAGFLTGHPHATDAVRCAHRRWPLRALVGTSLMDRHAPAAHLAPPGAPVAPPAGAPRLEFTVNPRFAVGCSTELLAEAGRAAGAGAAVQTHLSEQVREVELVRRLFPDCPDYANVYDRAGLLGPRTLLAHAVHLSAAEWALLAARRAVAVHCPSANIFLRSGLFDLDAARRHGVRVALGSDVAAGPDLAMPRVARAMIEVAKARAMTVAPSAHVPTPAEAWRLITEGNAAALGLDGGGRLDVGAPADLLVLAPPFPIDGDLVGRLLYGWRDEWIETRILAGREVGGGSDEATKRRSDGERPAGRP